MAIKTVMLQRGACEADVSRVASEAAIAASLVHSNIVATYSHDITGSPEKPRPEAGAPGGEHPVKGDSTFKFYLIQVRGRAAVPTPPGAGKRGMHAAVLPFLRPRLACIVCNNSPAASASVDCSTSALSPSTPSLTFAV